MDANFIDGEPQEEYVRDPSWLTGFLYFIMLCAMVLLAILVHGTAAKIATIVSFLGYAFLQMRARAMVDHKSRNETLLLSLLPLLFCIFVLIMNSAFNPRDPTQRLLDWR